MVAFLHDGGFGDMFPAIGAADVPILLTLILLEGILSFDNAAVLAALTNRLPPEHRRRALLYGIGGAYFFRVLAILGVAYLLANRWLQLLGAAYLIYLMVHHFGSGGHREEVHERKPVRFPGLSAFWATVLYVELTDVAFALDQIVVAVAFTDNISVIILAAFIGILFLRVAAYYIGRVMEWFPALESLAYLAVGFVGIKMSFGVFGYHMPYEKVLSVSITLGLIVVPPLVKFIRERFRRRPGGVPDDGPSGGPDSSIDASPAASADEDLVARGKDSGSPAEERREGLTPIGAAGLKR